MTEAAAWRVSSRTTLFVFGLIFLTWLTVQLQAVVLQLVFATIIAAAVAPLVDAATSERARLRHWHPGRGLATGLVFLTLPLLIALIGARIIAGLVPEIGLLLANLPAHLTVLQAWADSLLARYPSLASLAGGEDIRSHIQALLSWGVSVFGQALELAGVAVSLLGGALNMVFTLILAVYLTIDGARIRDYLVAFLPIERQANARHVTHRISQRLGSWARGQVTLCAIIGSLSWLGLILIGVPYAGVLALLAFLGEAIPTLGPILAAIPAIGIAFLVSPTHGLLTMGLYLVIQQLENNLIVPKVMGRAVNLHALVVMVAILAGGQLLGITGAILAIPVAASLSVIVDEIQKARVSAALSLPVSDTGTASLLMPPGSVESIASSGDLPLAAGDG